MLIYELPISAVRNLYTFVCVFCNWGIDIQHNVVNIKHEIYFNPHTIIHLHSLLVKYVSF